MDGHALKKENTRHPYIVNDQAVCNGSPSVEGTRTRVIDIALEYEILGHSPDEIISSHPQLNLTQIHDALSYYYENRDDLDQKIKQVQHFMTRLEEKYPSKMV